MDTRTLPAQSVSTRRLGVREEPRSSEPVRLLNAFIRAAEERREALRRALEERA